MASASVQFAYHGTLVASTVDSITLTGANGEIEVINRSGTAEIYYTVDGTTPTVGGNNTFVVPAAVGSYAVNMSDAVSPVVNLISSGTPTYSVIGGQS